MKLDSFGYRISNKQYISILSVGYEGVTNNKVLYTTRMPFIAEIGLEVFFFGFYKLLNGDVTAKLTASDYTNCYPRTSEPP